MCYEEGGEEKEIADFIVCSFIGLSDCYAKGIKKFYHPIYGDSMLTFNEKGGIDLWVNKKVDKLDFFEIIQKK